MAISCLCFYGILNVFLDLIVYVEFSGMIIVHNLSFLDWRLSYVDMLLLNFRFLLHNIFLVNSHVIQMNVYN